MKKLRSKLHWQPSTTSLCGSNILLVLKQKRPWPCQKKCRKNHKNIFRIISLKINVRSKVVEGLPISLIIQGCPDTLTMRFTAKPCILWKGLFHWICSKFYKVKQGHDFFWPPASWRLVEAKNTSRRPKYAWRSQFMEKSV